MDFGLRGTVFYAGFKGVVMDKNEELAKYFQIPWHEVTYRKGVRAECICGKNETLYLEGHHVNPDFTSPVLLLQEMVKREDWADFAKKCCFVVSSGYTTERPTKYYIDVELLISGKLRDVALEFFREREVK